MNRVTTACVASIAMSMASLASADLVDINPGLYDNVDEILEARVRLDGGNSQTWKSAFWRDSTMLSNSGINQNVFGDEQTYSFTMSYDSSSSEATISVSGLGILDLTQTYTMDAGNDIAGFKIYARSEADGSTTTLDNMMANVDGSTESLMDLISGGSQTWTERTYYVSELTESISVSGNFTFDWSDLTNRQGERFKFGIKWLQGSPVPAPGAFAVLGLAGFAGRRRRRG